MSVFPPPSPSAIIINYYYYQSKWDLIDRGVGQSVYRLLWSSLNEAVEEPADTDGPVTRPVQLRPPPQGVAG